ncbi:LPS translocon maturation chaperone LptM [Hydrogenophaga intermedia]|uniref:LPS translocon maturation chaperone LptM n=1 Tax=Hydrogenophaga intermedia TaxID=65786 RepID=UPI00333F0C5A
MFVGWLRILGSGFGPARVMALALLLSCLAACGQKGALYLPPPASDAQPKQPANAPARAPDTSPR